jgi:hypothetical protein
MFVMLSPASLHNIKINERIEEHWKEGGKDRGITFSIKKLVSYI